MTASGAPSPYGPNTPAVRRFLQRLAGKPLTDCVDAARDYLAIHRTAGFRDADRTLGIAIDRAGRTDARDAIVGPILQLMATHADRLRTRPDIEVTIDDLAEAALAAALALVSRDLIPTPTFELLYRPYAGIIPVEGQPPGSK